MAFKNHTTLPGENLYPATLPHEEAVQALKLILVHTAVDSPPILTRLCDIIFDVEKSTLVYLPFEGKKP